MWKLVSIIVLLVCAVAVEAGCSRGGLIGRARERRMECHEMRQESRVSRRAMIVNVVYAPAAAMPACK